VDAGAVEDDRLDLSLYQRGGSSRRWEKGEKKREDSDDQCGVASAAGSPSARSRMMEEGKFACRHWRGSPPKGKGRGKGRGGDRRFIYLDADRRRRGGERGRGPTPSTCESFLGEDVVRRSRDLRSGSESEGRGGKGEKGM